jgi:4-hydroxy-tetrahydrodipicolinate synthase
MTGHLDGRTAGVFAIAPTPFHPDGALDFDSLDRLVDFYFAAGCDGLTVLGVLGEASKLDADEALAVARRVITRAGGRPVIVGVSAPGYAAMRALARAALEMGAAGVMIAPQGALRTENQIAGWLRGAAEAIGPDVPWVLQDFPLTTGVEMSPEVIRRVVMENPGLKVLKHEAWPGLEKISTLRGYQADGSMRPLSLLVGNSGLFLDFELDRGVDGANTGYAYPEMLVEAVRLAKAGARDAMHDLFDAHLPLLRYEQQVGAGLAVRKYVLMKRGILASDTMRKPFVPLSAAGRTEIDYLMRRLERRLKG